MDKSEIEFYGKKYKGSLSWLNESTVVLEFQFKTQDLEDLLDIDENQELVIKVDGIDKVVKAKEPTLSKDINGNHAMMECKVVE